MHNDLLRPAHEDAADQEITASTVEPCPASPISIFPSHWPKMRERARAPGNANLELLVEHLTAVTQDGTAEEESTDLAETWRDIVAGRVRVRAEFCAAERAYLVLSKVVGASERLPVHGVEMLERTLLGDRQKVPAIELSLSPSFVSSLLSCTLVKLGVSCTPSRVPLLLVMLVHAARGIASARATSCRVEYGAENYVLVGAEFPGTRLSGKLSPALQVVVNMRLAGKTHAEIAALRKTSRRTVANQIAVAFRRFGVSSRLEMVNYLATAGQT